MSEGMIDHAKILRGLASNGDGYFSQEDIKRLHSAADAIESAALSAAEDYHLNEIAGCLAEYRDMPTKSLGLRLYQAVDRAMFAAVQRQKAGGA